MKSPLSREDHVMLQHLDVTWRRARREGMDPHLTVLAEEKRFGLVRKYDPTGGLYHGWMAAWRRRLWDERGFTTMLSGEELLRVRDALSRFHALRERLPTGQRDIGQYRTLQDLRSVIPSRIGENRRRKEADALRSVAMSQSRVLFREGRWMLIELRGFEAARFWGLGTRWCTTSCETTYLQYAERSPLLVLLTPRGRYQKQVGGQFRDAEDLDARIADLDDAPDEMRSLLLSFEIGRGGLSPARY